MSFCNVVCLKRISWMVSIVVQRRCVNVLFANLRNSVVLCKGCNLNGAVSSPAPPRALCSQFALYTQNAGNLVHLLTQSWYFPKVMSHQTHENHQKRINFTNVLHHGDRYRALQSKRSPRCGIANLKSDQNETHSNKCSVYA